MRLRPVLHEGMTLNPEAAPPPDMTAALRLLGAQGEAALEAFDTVLAGEVTPTWRALALLGRGLCEELRGSAGPAAADVRAALELWMATDPGAGAVDLAALRRGLSPGGDSVDRCEAP